MQLCVMQAKALLLLPDPAAAGLLPLAAPILGRSNYSHPGNPNEATNLVWMAGTRALVGSLTGNATEISEAFVRIESTGEVNAFGEGLQRDGSYWQHGAQLYSGWGHIKPQFVNQNGAKHRYGCVLGEKHVHIRSSLSHIGLTTFHLFSRYGAIWTGQMLFFGSMADGTPWAFSASAL